MKPVLGPFLYLIHVPLLTATTSDPLYCAQVIAIINLFLLASSPSIPSLPYYQADCESHFIMIKNENTVPVNIRVPSNPGLNKAPEPDSFIQEFFKSLRNTQFLCHLNCFRE